MVHHLMAHHLMVHHLMVHHLMAHHLMVHHLLVHHLMAHHLMVHHLMAHRVGDITKQLHPALPSSAHPFHTHCITYLMTPRHYHQQNLDTFRSTLPHRAPQPSSDPRPLLPALFCAISSTTLLLLHKRELEAGSPCLFQGLLHLQLCFRLCRDNWWAHVG